MASPRDWACLLAHDCMREAVDEGLGISAWPSMSARVREISMDARHLAGAARWLERLPEDAKVSRVKVSQEILSTEPESIEHDLLDFLKAAWTFHHPIETLEIACRAGDVLGILLESIDKSRLESMESSIASLRELRLREPCEVDAGGLARLPAACPNLRVLHLEGVGVSCAIQAIKDGALDLLALPLTDLSIALVEGQFEIAETESYAYSDSATTPRKRPRWPRTRGWTLTGSSCSMLPTGTASCFTRAASPTSTPCKGTRSCWTGTAASMDFSKKT